MQETGVLESILSPRVQTWFDILLGHTCYRAGELLQPHVCVSSAHDRGVEKALWRHGTKPPTANKKLTDLTI